jgi:hypothetical protein
MFAFTLADLTIARLAEWPIKPPSVLVPLIVPEKTGLVKMAEVEDPTNPELYSAPRTDPLKEQALRVTWLTRATNPAANEKIGTETVPAKLELAMETVPLAYPTIPPPEELTIVSWLDIEPLKVAVEIVALADATLRAITPPKKTPPSMSKVKVAELSERLPAVLTNPTTPPKVALAESALIPTFRNFKLDKFATALD